MGRFAQVTQAAIDAGDLDTAQASFRLVEQLMADPGPELENALNVSFFEMLDFEGPKGRAAWAVLPPALQKAWQEMQDYLVKLAKDGKALKGKRQ